MDTCHLAKFFLVDFFRRTLIRQNKDYTIEFNKHKYTFVSETSTYNIVGGEGVGFHSTVDHDDRISSLFHWFRGD